MNAKNYNIDSGTSRERLQNEQADRLLQIPTIWNSTDFLMVGARLTAIALTANISVSLIQSAPESVAIWGLLMFLLFSIGVLAWVVWNYKSKFHTAGWAMSLGVGIIFGISWGGLI